MDLARVIALLLQAKTLIPGIVQVLDEFFADKPELAPTWGELKDALQAAETDPTLADQLQAGVAAAIAAVLTGRSGIGPTHGHHG